MATKNGHKNWQADMLDKKSQRNDGLMASTNWHKYGNQKWPQTWQAEKHGNETQQAP